MPDVRKKSLTAKDLVTIAIYVALYFVTMFALAILGFLGPLAMFISLTVAAVLGGIPYVLFLSKVHKPGMITLFGVSYALLFVLIGHPLVALLVTLISSVCADVIYSTGAHTRLRTALTYAVFTFWYIGPMVPFILDRQAYLKVLTARKGGSEFAQEFDAFFSPLMLWVSLPTLFISGLLGGLLGYAMLRKHFSRAGLA
ncbi:MptD family putative ECF transporter S component [Dermabacteraceae bacterium TAE3-ERU27]|nr:MptD family putative ECF transporter S component [Dermabacteraceae bacterium TAE3-ERU27]